jgi:8-oxo-dGTP diphosphatase
MTPEPKNPRVGTAVWIRYGDTVLLGKREKGAGINTWSPPGGAIDMHETPTQCAVREVFEETGLTIQKPRLCGVMSDSDRANDAHWITLHFIADYEGGEPKDAVGEIGNWQWFHWDELPQPLFEPARNFQKNGYNPLKFN